MSTSNLSPTIDDVRAFWDANPLWTGETKFTPGTREYFQEHRQVVYRDCYAGKLDERVFVPVDREARVLDLGCGIGFWLVEFWERGYRNLSAADLSASSLQIARQRCAIYGVTADLSVRNAEATGFETHAFDHVNCQGVVHHTCDPRQAMKEIHRIVRPRGSASVSVYYRNAILRHWKLSQRAGKVMARLGGGLKGRGREDMMARSDIDDIVRRYDGAANPIGKAYDLQGFKDLIGREFRIEEIYYHFFPARSLPFPMPTPVHQLLDRRLPFMIYANLKRI
jgi:2-polyprenyl-3-methyl-5-hydroxy-6-metoxy-1,4-benzoquinol methylase